MKVKVRAEVGTAELDKDLDAIKALLTRKDKPRVVILVAEQNVGMAEPFAWWSKGQKEARRRGGLDLGTFENTFIDAIKNNGWTFVDHDAIEGKLQTHSAFTSDLSTPQVMRVRQAERRRSRHRRPGGGPEPGSERAGAGHVRGQRQRQPAGHQLRQRRDPRHR